MHPTPSTLVLIRSPQPHWDNVRAVLQAWPAGRVLAEVTDAAEARSRAATQMPSVILVDAAVADPPLVPLVGDLRATSPASKIIVLGARADLALWHRGVVGYFVWDDLRVETVLHGVITVLDADVLVGSRVVLEELLAAERRQHPRVAGLVLSAAERAPLQTEAAPRHVLLTPREHEVVEGIAAGLRYDVVAQRLCITASTVKSHAAHIKAKLGLSGRDDLGTAWRRRHGVPVVIADRSTSAVDGPITPGLIQKST